MALRGKCKPLGQLPDNRQRSVDCCCTVMKRCMKVGTSFPGGMVDGDMVDGDQNIGTLWSVQKPQSALTQQPTRLT